MTQYGEHTGVEKLHLSSKDLTTDHIRAIAQLFPQAMTESRSETGELRPAIDFDKLRDLLSHDLADGRETYEFSWVGKREAMAEAGRPTTKTLRPDLDESVNFEESENIFITGDNLEALKILQESYLGKVDMIYIDPPYNTGKDFVYSDKFSMDMAELEEGMDLRTEDGLLKKRLQPNLKTSARYHSDWLNMIYPRLVLARNLLKDSGVIFISIDDNEQANLKKVCDEIFGEENFVANFKWNKTSTPPSLSPKVRTKYEYILCYEKDKNERKYIGGLIDGGDAPLLNRGNPKRDILFDKNSVEFKFDGSFAPGHYDRVELKTDITIVDGRADEDFILSGEFKWTQDTVNKEVYEQGTTFIIKSDKFSVRFLRTEEKSKRPTDIISSENKVGTNENAKTELLNLLSDDVMSYPKPSSLIKYLLKFYEEKDTLILDFFAGSGTTADAVMQLNAEDGGQRRYILCTLDEETADKSAAKEAGYATIDQLSRERIRRAAAKLQAEQPDKVAGQDLGFKAFKVDSSNYRDVLNRPSDYSQQNLFESVSNIKDDRSDLDLLFQIMLSWGLELSLPIKVETIEEAKVYSVADDFLVACFADEVTDSLVRAIAQKLPDRVVFKDSSFTNSAAKINLTQIFKEISPNTKVKVV